MQELKKSGGFLFEISEHLGVIDALLSLAQKIVKHDWVMPNITDEPEVFIKNGWHPVLEQINEDLGKYIPVLKNDTVLNPNQNMMLVTGPNMSGKSTYMRQVAVIVILAKWALPFPPNLRILVR